MSVAPVRAAILVLLLGPGFAAMAAGLEVSVVDAEGTAVDGALVTVSGAGLAPRAPLQPVQHVMDQVDRQFVPRVLAIRVSDSVSFPNSDDIRHHVYSFSPAKRFELPLYHGIPAEPLRFDVAGTVALGCNIHDGMSAHIYVVDAPLYGVTQGGRIAFPALAEGDYEVRVTGPRLTEADAVERPVTVGPDAGTRIRVSVSRTMSTIAAETDRSPLEMKFRSLRREQP